MIRRARWLLLLAIVLISAFTAITYVTQRKAARQRRPHLSAKLPPNISATADMWEWEIKEGDRPKCRLRAKKFQQIKDPPMYMLEDLDMEIHKPGATTLDLVKSKKASFDVEKGILYSEGEVELTLNVPQPGQPPHGRQLTIHSSGVTFESKTNKVYTQRHATFSFDDGDGEATGAIYDPTAKELQMLDAVVLHWRGRTPDAKPMDIESGKLTYRESESKVLLYPWAKFKRDATTMEGGDSVVFLADGRLDRVESQNAHGVNVQDDRSLNYAADHLLLFFDDHSEIKQIQGIDHARLLNKAKSGETSVTSNRVDMDFVPGKGGSVLTQALATGKAHIESHPAPQPSGPPPIRILESEVVQVIMRDGGKEIAEMKTHAPGTVDFLPRRPIDKQRHLEGERMYMVYGPNNQLQTFRSVKTTTRTESKDKKGQVSISKTRSNDFLSEFDPKTGDMSKISQWGDFQYDEGVRHATAERADLDQPTQKITLNKTARMWDDTGSTSGDVIVLDQNTGDMVATGNVASTRLPDQKASNGGMLSPGEPMQARAQKMTTTERNKKIHYEGDAVLWQGASRLKAKQVYINRVDGTLDAKENVITTIPDDRSGDSSKDASKGTAVSANQTQTKPSANKQPAFSTVTSDSLLYSDKTKLAYFTGNTKLVRPNMVMTSKEMRVWFREEKDSAGKTDSQLDHLFADGTVRIDHKDAKRTKQGSSEHAEYYPDEERLVLTQGTPLVVDSVKGTTRGEKIVWFAKQDRLVVDNTGSGPSVSHINRERR